MRGSSGNEETTDSSLLAMIVFPVLFGLGYPYYGVNVTPAVNVNDGVVQPIVYANLSVFGNTAFTTLFATAVSHCQIDRVTVEILLIVVVTAPVILIHFPLAGSRDCN